MLCVVIVAVVVADGFVIQLKMPANWQFRSVNRSELCVCFIKSLTLRHSSCYCVWVEHNAQRTITTAAIIHVLDHIGRHIVVTCRVQIVVVAKPVSIHRWSSALVVVVVPVASHRVSCSWSYVYHIIHFCSDWKFPLVVHWHSNVKRSTCRSIE